MSEFFADPDEWETSSDDEEPVQLYEAAADFEYALNILVEVLRKEVRRQNQIEIYWSSLI